jgi:PAS domain S-box-containing protein
MLKYLFLKLHRSMIRNREVPFPSMALSLFFLTTLLLMAWLVYSVWRLHQFLSDATSYPETNISLEEIQDFLQRSIILIIATITTLLLSLTILSRALQRWRQIIVEFKRESSEAAEGKSIAEGKAAAQISSFHTILDHIPLAIFIKDVADDLRFILWNTKAEEMFGFNREQILHKTDIDLFFKQNEAGRSRAIDQQIIKSGRLFTSDEAVTAKDKTFSFRVVRVPIFDAQGRVSLILGYIEDPVSTAPISKLDNT